MRRLCTLPDSHEALGRAFAPIRAELAECDRRRAAAAVSVEAARGFLQCMTGRLLAVVEGRVTLAVEPPHYRYRRLRDTAPPASGRRAWKRVRSVMEGVGARVDGEAADAREAARAAVIERPPPVAGFLFEERIS